MPNHSIRAIDSWCNPFTELGIKTVFTENPEVAFMMGDQWGRHHQMRWHSPRSRGSSWARRWKSSAGVSAGAARRVLAESTLRGEPLTGSGIHQLPGDLQKAGLIFHGRLWVVWLQL